MKLVSIFDYLANGKQDLPFFVFRRQSIQQAVSTFRTKFPGDILYAVKTNPDKTIVSHLVEAGISAFDVASIQEIAYISENFPGNQLYFMHPVKPRYAIRSAYFDWGVRHFSLDSEAELEKILFETGYAKDLSLHLRLAVSNDYAKHGLKKKFGVFYQKAPTLLKNMRKCAESVGVSFHVGSQCMSPQSYADALRIVRDLVKDASIPLDYLNVGGGFPSIYPDSTPPPLSDYFETIVDSYYNFFDTRAVRLLAEPGRALVAESMSLIVRVDLRKGQYLYINEGTYGSLFDAGVPKMVYPVKLYKMRGAQAQDLIPFSFYGPTCDAIDYMPGPFYLPENVAEGDYIEIGQMGAYAKTMQTQFNGFSTAETLYTVEDPVLMSLYRDNVLRIGKKQCV
eukprot:TRINITY_DN18739_c0_g1_i3.p1 TRINITY_DN18739_c0_g1~~TRINITY_DN18739_c0_g1_i3.p1  ORF type:complete len:395 (+),score=-87.82 TRINITY_DN18739_c0_g1_i3:417-1601(+)